MKKEATEQEWLDAIERLFTWVKQQKKSEISRSEVESCIIGLRSLAKSPKGIQVLKLLQGYLDIMKKKNKKFLKIS